MEKLTMQEEEAMRWIWRIGPCFVKDVLAKYEDPKPPYTTLASDFHGCCVPDRSGGIAAILPENLPRPAGYRH